VAVAVVTLASWVLTASIGAWMLRDLIRRGGVRQQRAARDGLPPAVLFGHFTLALVGLLTWVLFTAAGWRWLAWLAVGLLMPAIGLGISTVTLWTPYPGPRHGLDSGPPASPLAGQLSDAALAGALADEQATGELVDDMVARLLAQPRPAPGPGRRLPALVPVAHGLAATATFLLAVLTAVGLR
jgi:hypothetical protein